MESWLVLSPGAVLTQSGTRCQRLAMVGASRCNPHRGEWSSYTIDRRKASERKAKARKCRKWRRRGGVTSTADINGSGPRDLPFRRTATSARRSFCGVHRSTSATPGRVRAQRASACLVVMCQTVSGLWPPTGVWLGGCAKWRRTFPPRRPRVSSGTRVPAGASNPWKQ